MTVELKKKKLKVSEIWDESVLTGVLEEEDVPREVWTLARQSIVARSAFSANALHIFVSSDSQSDCCQTIILTLYLHFITYPTHIGLIHIDHPTGPN